MTDAHLYAELAVDVLGQVLRGVDRAVLADGTAKGEHQRRETSTYKGWGGGYGRTKYDESSNHGNYLGAQTVGTITLGLGRDVSFSLSNDLFGERKQDRWRTSAAELTIGNFTLGTYVTTNDGRHESAGSTNKNIDPLLGANKHKKESWTNGVAYSAPAWFGIRNGNKINRFGYSHPYVQSITQNFVHKYIVPTPYFHPSPSFYEGGYFSSGFNNPLTLW